MSKPTLALIPSGYRATEVYSVLPSDGTGDFTFARTGEATRVRKDGLIETVATTVPRLDWLNSDCPSLLLEAAATNSQQYSELSTGKTVTGGTLTDNNAIAPTGEKKAMQLKEDTNNSRHRFYVGGVLSTTSGTQYTLSLFVKKQSDNRFIFINAGAFMGVSGSFNLDTQAVTGNVQLFETYANGWYRIGITATATATHTSGYFVQLQQGTSDADYTGDGSSVLVWGLQFEESSLSSYIANLGSGSTTRNAETCNSAGDANTFNDNEGVLYADIAALADDLTYRMIALSDSNSSDHVRIYYTASTNKISIAVKSNGSNQYLFLNHSVTDVTNFIKIAVKYKANDFATFINGVKVDDQTTTANTPIGLDRLNFDSGSGSSDFYGKVKDLRYYDTALTDAELKELTT